MFESSATVCRSSAGVCDVAENCTGSGADCPADMFESSATVCRSAAGVCDVAENCTGSGADCPADAFVPSRTGTCVIASGFSGSGSGGGSGANCLANYVQRDRGECLHHIDVRQLQRRPLRGRERGVQLFQRRLLRARRRRARARRLPPAPVNICASTFSGSSASWNYTVTGPCNNVCRPSAGVCDPEETCTGSGPDCPADVFESSSTVCRSSAGVCDPAERCTGSGADCPADIFESSAMVCRPSAGVCDPAENCTGSGADCPADMLETSDTVCRSAAGVCDVAENCTGSGPDCPADSVAGAFVICRGSAGVCDAVENCDGMDPNCPSDMKQPSGTVCRPGMDACDVVEVCDGTSNTCPMDLMCTTTTSSSTSTSTTTSTTTSTLPPQVGCGTTQDPCQVKVVKGSKPPVYFTNLQQAVNAASNGSTLTVTGRCFGPVFVNKRSSLTIQGIAPTQSGCPSGGLQPGDLTSTVEGTVDHLIKITAGSNIKVQFLNLVESPSAGLEIKDASKVTAFCNCIARNDEGVELHAATSSIVLKNLVEDNTTAGIRFNRSAKIAKKNQVTDNLVRNNGTDGILVSEESTQNTVKQNAVSGNSDDGIELLDGTKNQVIDNVVVGNANRGVRDRRRGQNVVKNNTIMGNGDAQVNQATCVSGKKNTGNNVPPPCSKCDPRPCRGSESRAWVCRVPWVVRTPCRGRHQPARQTCRTRRAETSIPKLCRASFCWPRHAVGTTGGRSTLASGPTRDMGRGSTKARRRAASSGSFAASILARLTITLHCFQVASSCILPSSIRTPRPSGIASSTFFANSDLLDRRAEDLLRDRDLARVQRPGADAAEEERGAELVLAAERVGDVAERAVERQGAGRGAGVDHARDRVVPRVLLRGRARRVGVLRVGIGAHEVGGVAAADARRLHAARGGEVGGAEAHALHARARGADLLDVGDAERGLEDRVHQDRPLHLVLRLELREQAVDVVDVPRPLDLGDHDHLEPVADLADQRRDVVEAPRRCRGC